MTPPKTAGATDAAPRWATAALVLADELHDAQSAKPRQAELGLGSPATNPPLDLNAPPMLSGELTIAGGIAEDVLTVPLTAVTDTLTVDALARRFVIQEDLTAQLAETLLNAGEARGVHVVTDARHLCMCGRGPAQPGASTRVEIALGEPLG